MQNLNLPPILLPTLTSALGLAGLSGGIYTFISPLDAIRPFGLIPPPPTPTTSSTSPSSNQSHSTAFQHALIRTYGIRNVGVGLSTLFLTYFWKSQPLNSVAERVARKCLGICLVVGTVVGAGDAWIVRRFGLEYEGEKEGSGGLGEDERKEVFGASRGHAIVSVVILGCGLGLLFG